MKMEYIIGNTQIDKIADENAVPLESLPKVWQKIANSAEGYEQMKDRNTYIKMAQLFLYKLSEGEIDLFNERDDLKSSKEGFKKLFQKLAWETLEFYGEDFHISRYPNFEILKKNLNLKDPEYKTRSKVIKIAENLFDEFGYLLPASFYWVHLAPLYRESPFQVVPLRFSKQDKLNARSWDAALHGQKVFPMQMRIQSVSSKEGLLWEHGCGCNHALSQAGITDEAFNYSIRSDMKKVWIRDYVWTSWYEYAFFQITPVTKFLIASD